MTRVLCAVACAAYSCPYNTDHDPRAAEGPACEVSADRAVEMLLAIPGVWLSEPSSR